MYYSGKQRWTIAAKTLYCETTNKNNNINNNNKFKTKEIPHYNCIAL